MGMLLIVAAMVAVPAVILSLMGGMNVLSMVVTIVAISIFGGVLREYVRHRKDSGGVTQKELLEIKNHIAQIEADIADFIIKQV